MNIQYRICSFLEYTPNLLINYLPKKTLYYSNGYLQKNSLTFANILIIVGETKYRIR